MVRKILRLAQRHHELSGEFVSLEVMDLFVSLDLIDCYIPVLIPFHTRCTTDLCSKQGLVHDS